MFERTKATDPLESWTLPDAILIEDGYYDLIVSRKIIKNGLSLVDVECMIALKARAYNDLIDRKTPRVPPFQGNSRSKVNEPLLSSYHKEVNAGSVKRLKMEDRRVESPTLKFVCIGQH